MSEVTIIGAGPAGSLLAIYLAKRGISVDVFEARGDMRTEKVERGRSINMALSDRGLLALSRIGMDEYMLREAVPMRGRMVHPVSGEAKMQPYSGRDGEYINSISRSGLNIALINEAEKYDQVEFHFNERCTDVDPDRGMATFASGGTITSRTIIAADGAGSAVRQAMAKRVSNFRSSSDFLEHGYKELHIPPGVASDRADKNPVAPPTTPACGHPSSGRRRASGSALNMNALHIWPRHQFMMIALPNFDGSFTCTLFLANGNAAENGDTAFDRLVDGRSVQRFFEREFPSAVPLMPTLVEDFFANPTGSLGTLRCSPWNIGGKLLLIGDAAHAMVPFYGQGMNCAFEDVRVLAELVDSQLSEPPASAGGHIDWQKIFEEYSATRKPNADAIQDVAVENFYEMRDAVADPVFQRKRELETLLEQTFPDYFSKYSMVTFREDLPYSEAKRLGNAQDELLMNICRPIKNVAELDIESVINEIRKLK
ncbi:MAG: FAD-dependent monooxygenase [Chloracidobacterium sp.]|nr:FAD-dependent monooxygenase [Chloracidobacterium sp.]